MTGNSAKKDCFVALNVNYTKTYTVLFRTYYKFLLRTEQFHEEQYQCKKLGQKKNLNIYHKD